MTDDFPQNLRLLCGYYKSISDVCRRLGINRSQFNRYLNGRSQPSANMMLKLCDFFGVEEHEIHLPHSQFERLVKVRPRRIEEEAASPLSDSFDQLKALNALSRLEKYLGYYFEYYQSMACPGRILRTLICLEQHDDQIFYQRTERLRPTPGEKICHGVYRGMAHLLVDRIFLVDYETQTGNEMTQTILFPSFKNRLTRLNGLKLGVSGSGERMPCCARVVYEYLGTDVDKHKALSLCGLYDQDTGEIDTALKQAITNSISPEEWYFRALPY